MKQLTLILLGILTLIALPACQPDVALASMAAENQEEAPKGPHGGRLLTDGDLALELSIYMAGTNPEYRAWLTEAGDAIDPGNADVTVTLARLGGVTDIIRFEPAGEYLRGQSVVYEPHSFDVTVEARYAGKNYRWDFDSYEGRVTIPAAIASEAEIRTEAVGPAIIRDYVAVYGRTIQDPEKISHVTARFAGIIRNVRVGIGDEVSKGQELAVVEANDSLTRYVIKAPISGTITQRHANAGESTAARDLFTIVDPSSLWAELAIFPSDRARVAVGAPVSLRTAVGDVATSGTIAVISPQAANNQSVTALVQLDNSTGLLAAGMYLTGEVEVGRHAVPLAVKRIGLQAYRDFTVVFAKFDDTYEVRMLELGRQDDTWAEVLGGIDLGSDYVTENSYLIKADIEKSGVSHDH